jgi:hypothetical protein
LTVPRSRLCTGTRFGVAVAATTVALTAPAPTATSAATPPDSTSTGSVSAARGPQRWVVSLGDSYISGEGGRWAGNITGDPERVDALGEDAYHDGRGGERIPGCHRSESAEVHVAARNLRGKNLACSGATTRTDASGDDFKPGIDFYRDGQGRVGQLVLLRRFAKSHQVSDVVISIGGNDYGFASIVEHCLKNFETTAGTPVADYCSDDEAVTRHFTRKNVAAVTADITDALRRTAKAMRQAGYRRSDYDIVVQNYPSPLAPGKQLRYAENQVERGAGAGIGGCPFFDRDADKAQTLMLATINDSVRRAVRHSNLSNIHRLDLTRAYVGSRLCEKGSHQLQETDLATWQAPGAVDQLEWVNMIYLPPAHPRPWQTQESLHPNYWGQLALRNCVRKAVKGPGADGGRCVHTAPGLTRRGEPHMRLRDH